MPDPTTKEQWAKAAADAHDALHRLVELKDHMEVAANDVDFPDSEQTEGEIEERNLRIESIIDMDLDNALENAAACEDFEVPAWVD